MLYNNNNNNNKEHTLLYVATEWFVWQYDTFRDKWDPVTTAWQVLRLRMEERSPIWRVAANVLNKQARTADKWCSSSLGVGRGAKNSSP